MSHMPPPLLHDLQTSYSTALYGAPHRLNLSTVRVIWPAALGAAARESLTPNVTRCGLPSTHWHGVRREFGVGAVPPRRLYVDTQNALLNANAMWVEQPPERLLGATMSNSWVEVSELSRCSTTLVGLSASSVTVQAPASHVLFCVGVSKLAPWRPPNCVRLMHAYRASCERATGEPLLLLLARRARQWRHADVALRGARHAEATAKISSLRGPPGQHQHRAGEMAQRSLSRCVQAVASLSTSAGRS